MLRLRWLRIVVVGFVLVQALAMLTGVPVSGQAAPLSAPQMGGLFEQWVDAQHAGDILYILYANPPRIERYHLLNQSWLPDLPLTAVPTAFRVQGSEILVAFGKTLARSSLDGSAWVEVWPGIKPITQIVVDDQFIFACHENVYDYDDIYSLNRATGAFISQEDYGNVICASLSIAPGMRTLFSRTQNLGPADIQKLEYTETGDLLFWRDSPYHGDLPEAKETWVFPDESRVVENTGTVYDASSLTFSTTLLDAVDDITFVGNVAVVLRLQTLISYDQRLIEQGTYRLPAAVNNIFAVNNTIYTLRAGPERAIVEAIPLNLFQMHTPAAPVDAYGRPYTIDDLAYDNNGVVYLMNKASRNIFRWSITERKYLEPITGTHEPQYITYAPYTDKLYVAYNSKEIKEFDAAGGGAQSPFMVLKNLPCGLDAAGPVILVCEKAVNFWNIQLFTVNPSGDVLANLGMGKGIQDFLWNDQQSRMVILYPRYLSRLTISPNGAMTTLFDYYSDDIDFRRPLRLSEDKTKLFVGPRKLYSLSNPDELTLAGQLPEDMQDVAWFNGSLYSLRFPGLDSRLEKWNADLTPAASRTLTGTPLYLFATKEGLLAITDVGGRPRFTLWDDQLNPVYQPPVSDFSVPQPTGVVPFSVHFTNTSQFAQGASYLWDFGDGHTSTEVSPTHVYTQVGKYTVTLTVTGPAGEDRSIWVDEINVVLRTYLPLVQYTFPVTFFNKVCHTFPLVIDGSWNVGDMTECVTKIENFGKLRVHFSWTLDKMYPGCVNKQSDYGNTNMYMKDQSGNRYDHFSAGGTGMGPISCMWDDYTYTGWFDFPPPLVPAPVFTFFDDDQQIQLGPLPLQ